MSTVRVTVARFTDAERAHWLASAASVLSESERERLVMISDPDLRTQHAVGRAIIRLIGAEASGLHPTRLEIAVSDAGKPRLANLPGLHVSVAHTGQVVVVATCLSSAVGVDIEHALPTAAHQRRLAERLFAESEIIWLGNIPDVSVPDWFSSAWALKEAVGKALGVGIFPALSGVTVEARAGGVCLAAVWSGPAAGCWSVHQMTAPAGDEKIAIAMPTPGIELGPVSQLTLADFSITCSRAGG